MSSLTASPFPLVQRTDAGKDITWLYACVSSVGMSHMCMIDALFIRTEFWHFLNFIHVEGP